MTYEAYPHPSMRAKYRDFIRRTYASDIEDLNVQESAIRRHTNEWMDKFPTVHKIDEELVRELRYNLPP